MAAATLEFTEAQLSIEEMRFLRNVAARRNLIFQHRRKMAETDVATDWVPKVAAGEEYQAYQTQLAEDWNNLANKHGLTDLQEDIMGDNVINSPERSLIRSMEELANDTTLVIPEDTTLFELNNANNLVAVEDAASGWTGTDGFNDFITAVNSDGVIDFGEAKCLQLMADYNPTEPMKEENYVIPGKTVGGDTQAEFEAAFEACSETGEFDADTFSNFLSENLQEGPTDIGEWFSFGTEINGDIVEQGVSEGGWVMMVVFNLIPFLLVGGYYLMTLFAFDDENHKMPTWLNVLAGTTAVVCQAAAVVGSVSMHSNATFEGDFSMLTSAANGLLVTGLVLFAFSAICGLIKYTKCFGLLDKNQ